MVDKLSKSTIRTLLETVFTVSVRDIPDFKKAREEENLMYPHKKRHDGIYRHPENGRKCAYVTADLITDAGFSPHLRQVFEEVTQKSRKYRHFWQKGDVVIWDNLAVMHRAGTRGGGSGPADRTPRMYISYTELAFIGRQIFLGFKRLKSRSLLNPFVNLGFEFSFVTLVKEQ